MAATEPARRLYLLPEERPGAGPRRYRLARMEVVALATPPHPDATARYLTDDHTGTPSEEADS